MNNKARLLIIIETVLLSIAQCSCKVGDTLQFNNCKKVSFRTTGGGVVKCEIPDGYVQDKIRIYKGDRTTLIIPYIDSSLLYICTDIYNNPNRDNIERLHTAASSWRIHYEMLYAIKEQGIPDKLKQKIYTECNCTYSDLLDYQVPETVDLHGEGEGYIWRDVLKNDVCMGYIVKDTTNKKSFDHCIETYIYKSPKGITQYYDYVDLACKGEKQHWIMVSINTDRNAFTGEGGFSIGGLQPLVHELKHCYQFYSMESSLNFW